MKPFYWPLYMLLHSLSLGCDNYNLNNFLPHYYLDFQKLYKLSETIWSFLKLSEPTIKFKYSSRGRWSLNSSKVLIMWFMTISSHSFLLLYFSFCVALTSYLFWLQQWSEIYGLHLAGRSTFLIWYDGGDLCKSFGI